MQYLGDFPEDATVYIPFNTFSSNDPQASVTITNLVAADIKVHKDGGTTQIVTDGATVAIDFDAITGNHLITVDTSAHADYSVGSDYMVRIEGTTVDGGTINAWVGSFSIENRFNEVDVTKWLGTAAATPTVAGVPEVDLTHMAGGTQSVTDLKDFADAGYDPATNKVQGVVLVDTTTTNTDMVTEPPTSAANADAVWDEAASGHVGAGTFGEQCGTDIDAILADTNELQTDDVPGLIAALNDVSTAEVLTQVNAALDTAISELGVAAPTATPTLRTGLMLLYMALRNKTVVQTSGVDALEIYNDAGTKIASKALTDDGSDYTEAEMA